MFAHMFSTYINVSTDSETEVDQEPPEGHVSSESSPVLTTSMGAGPTPAQNPVLTGALTIIEDSGGGEHIFLLFWNHLNSSVTYIRPAPNHHGSEGSATGG